MNLPESLFDWFVSATLRGSLLVAAVLLLQYALRGRLPAFWRHALWLPVLFVLASPVLPASRWSLEDGFASKSAQVTAKLPALRVDFSKTTGVAAGSGVVAPPALEIREPMLPARDLKSIAAVTWLGGAAVLLLVGLLGHAQTLRRLWRAAMPVDPELQTEVARATESVGLRRVPRLLVSSLIDSPAVTGMVRPLLLLPANFAESCEREERRLILLHELMHLRRGDLLVNGLLFLLQALHWCNPVVWLAFARLRADREVACDSAVLATAGRDARQAYGHALLKLSSAQRHPAWSLGFVGVFGRDRGMRSRVQAIAAYRPAHPAWALPALALIAGLVVAGGTRAQSGAAGDVTGAESTGEVKARQQVIIETKIIEVQGDLDLSNFAGTKGAAGVTFFRDAKETQAFFRSLSERADVDVLSAPKVVTFSGQQATVEDGREVVVPAREEPRMTGLKLGFLPLVKGDQIEMQVDFLFTRMIDAETGQELVEVPEDGEVAFAEVRTDSEVLLNPGQTVLLGVGEASLYFTMTARLAGGQEENLQMLEIDKLEFKGASLEEVVEFLRLRSRELDPEGQGVNFVITSAAMQAARDVKITLKLSNMTLSEVLRYVAEMAGVSLRVNGNTVVLDALQVQGQAKPESIAPGAAGPDVLARAPEAVALATGSLQEAEKELSELRAHHKDKQPTLLPQLQKITGLEIAQTPENVLQSKLNTIVIPQLNFRDAALEEVVDFLRLRSRELDSEGQGVNFVISGAAMQAAREAKINMQLSNVPLSEALRYVADMAGLQLQVDEYAAVLAVPKS